MANILVVDDQKAIRSMFKAIFKQISHDVDYCEDGAQALAAANKKRYSLVLADLVMPELDGIELTEELRQLNDYTETPIFIVTSIKSEEKKQLAIKVGANGWVTKPISPDKVLKLVSQTIGE